MSEQTTPPNVAKKWEQLRAYVREAGIQGVGFGELSPTTKIMQSALAGEQDEPLVFFVVVDDTVYTVLNVYVAQNLTEAQKTGILPKLNELNEAYPMLKYFINRDAQLVLTCSMPAGDDHFDPALVIALVDQVQGHLQTEEPVLRAELNKLGESDAE